LKFPIKINLKITMNNKIKIMKNTMSTTRKTKELIYDPTIVLNEKNLLKDCLNLSKNNEK